MSTGSLETEAQQIELFDQTTSEAQARMLEQALDGRDQDAQDSGDPIAKFLDAYVAGTKHRSSPS